MSKDLLIVFVKNGTLGKVKTRLAKIVGDNKALEVYKQLVHITKVAAKNVSAEKHVYFSEAIQEESWEGCFKSVQKGNDLGEKMLNAFDAGFLNGQEKVVLIGSDLPDISSEIIDEGFAQLENNDVVFGPAEDGGYYFIGMKKPHEFLFKNKPWSQSELLKTTLDELGKQDVSFSLLETLNDIDTFEDFKSSKLYIDA